MARENSDWGYDRIVGAMANLGYRLSDQTVGNILQRHGIPPAPERQRKTTWTDFIRAHLSVLAGTDFFSVEVLTLRGLVTYYMLFFIHLESRRYLIHDRDTKFTDSFRAIIRSGHVKPLKLPARSPNLNAYAERWVRSVKEEALSKLILFGEASLRCALREYVTHFHEEQNHQGKGNVLLFRSSQEPATCRNQAVRCWAVYWNITINRPHEYIGPTPINFDVKCAGAPSALNPLAACDEAGTGNGITVNSTRARRR